MDDGDLDGEVRVIVGYSRYPRPPRVRVIRETLETPKQPQELNINFLLDSFLFLKSSTYRITKPNYGNNK
jgi:hypothetical protein